jgi:adhesin/invasin
VIPTRPAAGSALALFVTGLGETTPPLASGSAAPTDALYTAIASVTAMIGGQAAQVLFAGLAPGYAGLYQVNVVVPQLAAGDYAVQITVGGVASNTVTVSVR